MADYWPAANGNWSTLSNWLTATGQTAGVLPTSADDVFADNRTVTVDISPRVNSVRTTQRTGGTAGGSFTLSNNVSLTATVTPGTTTCVTFGNTGASSIVGFISGSSSSNIASVTNTSTGTLTILGNIEAGINGNSYGVNNSSTGAVTIFGNLSGARTVTSTGYGVFNSGLFPSTVNIVGNCFGRVSSGAFNNSTGTINVTGGCFGSSTNSGILGINNNSTGRVFINGNAIAGDASAGANNASTGLLYITRVVGNSFGLGSVGINSIVGASNSQNGLMYVEQFEFGSRGQTPISGPVYILPSNRNTLTGILTALGNTVTFYNSLSVDGLLPPVSSVQAGVVYNVGNTVGTMAVPSASAVQFGVAVDNTTGTAALQPQDVWGYARLSATQVDSMGDRLRNTATTQSIGYQIASFNL